MSPRVRGHGETDATRRFTQAQPDKTSLPLAAG